MPVANDSHVATEAYRAITAAAAVTILPKQAVMYRSFLIFKAPNQTPVLYSKHEFPNSIRADGPEAARIVR